MVDRLLCDFQLGIGVLIGGRVVVAVVVGEVGTGDVQSNAMARQKSVRCGIQFDRVLDDFVWSNQCWLIKSISVTCPDHSQSNVSGHAIRSDVDQPSEEVRIGRGGRCVEFDRCVPCHLEPFGQRFGLIDKDVLPIGKWTLIGWADLQTGAVE